MTTHLLPQLLGSYLALLLVACAVAVAAKRMHLPYTVALVLVGLLIAVLKLAPGLIISKDVIFTLILPPLLFLGALEMDLDDLKHNWMSITALAIPGVLLSTALIGWCVHWLWGVDLLVGLLFGALITPTDPISVLAICREVNAPKRLRVILEGESLFNDGTGIVLFGIILGVLTGQASVHVGRVIGEFVQVAVGGTIVGATLGYAVYRLLALTHDHLVEVTLTVILAFGTSVVAEMLHVSGVIATVVAGLVIGNYGTLLSMSPKARDVVAHFWEALGFIVNSILFLLIGLELQALSFMHVQDMAWPIVGTLLMVQVARMATAYPITWLQRRWRPVPLPAAWEHIFYWGGLRGSIPLALVVGLPPSFPYRDAFLLVAFIIVLCSLVVQGVTMRPLLVRLGLGSAHG